MTIESIRLAQEYLTVSESDRKRKIIDVETLLNNHPLISVVRFLEELLTDKKRVLKELVLKDKTDGEIDRVIASLFRIQMALNNLKREIEPEEGKDTYGETEPGAGKGIGFPARGLRGDRGTRIRKNINHDGADRKAG